MFKVIGRMRLKIHAPAEFVINHLNKADVAMSNVQKEANSVTLMIDKTQYKLCKESLRRAGILFDIEEQVGFFQSLKKLLTSYGLIIGILAGVGMIALYSQSVLAVNVTGNTCLEDKKIYDVLRNNNIALPTLKNNVDLASLQTAIESIPEVSQATVALEGVTLNINILEALPKVNIIPEDDYTPITAIYDGVVTSIYATCGTPIVNVGDKIKAGDCLIAPYKIDESGNNIPCRAEGTIKARVNFSHTQVYGDKTFVTVRTGRTQKMTALVLPSIDYTPKPNFCLYETEICSECLTNVIPMTLTTWTTYELTYEEIDFNLEKELPRLLEEGYSSLKATLPAGYEILDKGYFVKIVDKMSELSIYYTLEIEIGSK